MRGRFPENRQWQIANPSSLPSPFHSIENRKSQIANFAMTTAILAILAAAIPLIVWLIRRHLTHEDDPWTQHTEKREAIAKEILRNDETAANRIANRKSQIP